MTAKGRLCRQARTPGSTLPVGVCTSPNQAIHSLHALGPAAAEGDRVTGWKGSLLLPVYQNCP